MSYDHDELHKYRQDPPILILERPTRARRAAAHCIVVAASTAVRTGAVLLVRPAVRLAVVAAKLLRWRRPCSCTARAHFDFRPRTTSASLRGLTRVLIDTQRR